MDGCGSDALPEELLVKSLRAIVVRMREGMERWREWRV